MSFVWEKFPQSLSWTEMKPLIHSFLSATWKCARRAAPHSDERLVRPETMVAIAFQNRYPTRRSRHFVSVPVNIILFSYFIFPLNWRRGYSLFFSFIFSFFLKGRICCQKYSWTASLFLWWRKWFIYFTVTSALKWQQGTVELRAWSLVPSLGSWSAHGIWSVSSTWLPRAQNTHTSCLVCAPCRAQTSRSPPYLSNQRRLPAAFLAGSACWFFSRDWLLFWLLCSSQHPHPCPSPPGSDPPM